MGEKKEEIKEPEVPKPDPNLIREVSKNVPPKKDT